MSKRWSKNTKKWEMRREREVFSSFILKNYSMDHTSRQNRMADGMRWLSLSQGLPLNGSLQWHRIFFFIIIWNFAEELIKEILLSKSGMILTFCIASYGFWYPLFPPLRLLYLGFLAAIAVFGHWIFPSKHCLQVFPEREGSGYRNNILFDTF
jgi:hypothetical protein